VSERRGQNGQEWCSLRVRFDERELILLRGAEHVRGVDLARNARPTALRDALSLAKAGHKLRAAAPGVSLTFEETELRLLMEASRFASEEVHWAAAQRDADARSPRRDAVFAAFPELVERGVWRSFGLTRELDELSGRLQRALSH
jgi:hypothetical protein